MSLAGNKLFLVGFMGCGKSTIGKRLAQQLGYSFADTDSLLEQELGMAVSEYFALESEERFRERESLLLQKLAAQNGAMVIATGGGTPCFHNGMELMNKSGHTIYFQLSPQQLCRRLSTSIKERPLLKGRTNDELLLYIQQLLQQREPVYKQASLTLDATSGDIETLANQLRILGLV